MAHSTFAAEVSPESSSTQVNEARRVPEPTVLSSVDSTAVVLDVLPEGSCPQHTTEASLANIGSQAELKDTTNEAETQADAQRQQPCSRPSPTSSGECRICLSDEQPENIVRPCACSGTVACTHVACLRRWCVEQNSLLCELCGQPFASKYVGDIVVTREIKVLDQVALARRMREQWFASARQRKINMVVSLLLGAFFPAAGLTILLVFAR